MGGSKRKTQLWGPTLVAVICLAFFLWIFARNWANGILFLAVVVAFSCAQIVRLSYVIREDKAEK